MFWFVSIFRVCVTCMKHQIKDVNNFPYLQVSVFDCAHCHLFCISTARMCFGLMKLVSREKKKNPIKAAELKA